MYYPYPYTTGISPFSGPSKTFGFVFALLGGTLFWYMTKDDLPKNKLYLYTALSAILGYWVGYILIALFYALTSR